LAVHHFEASRKKLPEGCGYPVSKSSSDILRHGSISWQTAVLPFIDENPLWERAWEAQTADPTTATSRLHDEVSGAVIPLLLCPTERLRIGYNTANNEKWGVTSYIGVAGTNKWVFDGIFHRDFVVRLADITDGTSNTLMIGERPSGPRGWYSAWYASWGNCVCWDNQILHAGNGRWNPNHAGCLNSTGNFRSGKLDEMCDANHFWSTHPGGANFAFADGSVKLLSYSQSNVIPALATRAGAEPLE
jgi:prepilin-type processing-associated H-X9-DG protein